MAKPAIGEPIPVGALQRLTDETAPALPAPEPAATGEWFDLMTMGWQLTLLPAMVWSSYLTASWKAWENSQQPQWPIR